MCRGSGVAARLRFEALPLLDGIAELARVPYRTGAARRNWESYGHEVALTNGVADWQRDILCDPQTSGGLLIAVAPDGVSQVLTTLRDAGFARAAVIGELIDAPPGVQV
jgi:selenide,water dikinase